MPFQKGKAKTGGRGKGTRNKISATVRERLEEFGVDPVRGLLSIAANPECSLELKAKVFSDLCSYCFPKQKHVEISAPSLADFSLDDLRAMLTRIQEARGPRAKQTIQ
ncbi:MAG TPA: hypothetical protein VH601_19250 [Bryobacteraceae bacterium]